MKKAKRIKENLKIVIGIFLGFVIGGTSIVAAFTITSQDIFYENDLPNINNVQEVIEDLYNSSKNYTKIAIKDILLLENGLRYTGLNPNNYVLFNNELWRIIGVFDGKIKIIRKESIGNYAWNDTEKNDWETSYLYRYLNTIYYESIDTTSKGMIENAIWKVGGWGVVSVNTRLMYAYEQSQKGTHSLSTKTKGYVGLMSASDYGYASNKCYKETNLKDYNNAICTNTNWLYLKNKEWLITPHTYYDTSVFGINNEGSLTLFHSSNFQAVRPVLYLKQNVYIKGGFGTLESPYELFIEDF